MSEMLGNHYFYNRDFKSAVYEYENVMIKYPNNLLVKRKAIVCYVKQGNLDKALKMLVEILRKDNSFTKNYDKIDEDCPCRDLIFEFETKLSTNKDNYKIILSLGILWLNCNMQHSIEYFLKARELNPNQKYFSDILKIISNTLIIQESSYHPNHKRSDL